MRPKGGDIGCPQCGNALRVTQAQIGTFDRRRIMFRVTETKWLAECPRDIEGCGRSWEGTTMRGLRQMLQDMEAHLRKGAAKKGP
jgi:hypothetical protein